MATLLLPDPHYGKGETRPPTWDVQDPHQQGPCEATRRPRVGVGVRVPHHSLMPASTPAAPSNTPEPSRALSTFRGWWLLWAGGLGRPRSPAVLPPARPGTAGNVSSSQPETRPVLFRMSHPVLRKLSFKNSLGRERRPGWAKTCPGTWLPGCRVEGRGRPGPESSG